MNVSRQEAQESLEAIQQAATQMRRSIASGSTPYYMILWGAIWFIGYLGSYLVNELQGWIWMGLTLLGSLISALLGLRLRTKVRSMGFNRFLLLWLAIIGYGLIFLWIARPTRGEQGSLLIVAFLMFGYVIMGLWFENYAAWVGLMITALALIGYIFLYPYFYLWMAFLGGGTLIASGLYILRRWK